MTQGTSSQEGILVFTCVVYMLSICLLASGVALRMQSVS